MTRANQLTLEATWRDRARKTAQEVLAIANRCDEDYPEACEQCIFVAAALVRTALEEQTRGSSVTWGDLPESIRSLCDSLKPPFHSHEWDNLNIAEQRDWLLKQRAERATDAHGERLSRWPSTRFSWWTKTVTSSICAMAWATHPRSSRAAPPPKSRKSSC